MDNCQRFALYPTVTVIQIIKLIPEIIDKYLQLSHCNEREQTKLAINEMDQYAVATVHSPSQQTQLLLRVIYFVIVKRFNV